MELVNDGKSIPLAKHYFSTTLPFRARVKMPSDERARSVIANFTVRNNTTLTMTSFPFFSAVLVTNRSTGDEEIRIRRTYTYFILSNEVSDTLSNLLCKFNCNSNESRRVVTVVKVKQNDIIVIAYTEYRKNCFTRNGGIECSVAFLEFSECEIRTL